MAEAPNTERVLWGIASARALRAHWALIELGLDYRIERVQSRSGDTESEAFARLNPGRKIPVLQDGGLTLTESPAIVTYLAERYSRPGARLIPEDMAERAHYHEWVLLISMELDATSLYMLRRHAYLPEIYGAAPEAVQSARDYFERMIEAAAARLDDGRTWLLGDAFSGADILMTTCLDWALRYELSLPEVFRTYRERVIARPGYAAARAANEFAMSGPLAGFRVVDLTSVVSGPMATAMLADQGAEIIKIEPPGGDITRRSRAAYGEMPPLFITCNRGKRSVVVDLKRPEGRDVAWRLLATADVFVQNFRPGAIERLGLGADEVLKTYPGLVYMSISGVGESGPYAGRRVYDPVVQALSGMADIQSDPASKRPRMVRTLIADKTTAVYAAQAVTAALLHRCRTGEGQHVRLSMLDTLVAHIWPEGMAPFTAIEQGTQEAWNSGHDMIFETRDGYLTAGTVSDAEWRGLCRALEKPEWLADPRFETPALRSENRQARLALIEKMAAGTTEHWLGLFEREDVPCAPVHRRRAMIDDPQVRANTLVVEIEQPGVGPVRQARPAARYEGTPARIGGPAPRLGADTVAVLEEAGYGVGEIEALRAAGVINAAPETEAS